MKPNTENGQPENAGDGTPAAVVELSPKAAALIALNDPAVTGLDFVIALAESGLASFDVKRGLLLTAVHPTDKDENGSAVTFLVPIARLHGLREITLGKTAEKFNPNADAKKALASLKKKLPNMTEAELIELFQSL